MTPTAPDCRECAPATRRGASAALALGATLALALALAARPAAAQPFALLPKLASSSFEARAAQLFEEAGKDRDAGLLGQAADKYRGALRLLEHPIIRYDLALVLIELKQPVEAVEQLEEVIRSGAAGLGGRTTELEHARQKLRYLLERELVTVRVTCRRHGAKVWIDGKPLFTVQRAGARADITRVRRVEPGEHTFLAEMPGDEANVAFVRSIGPADTAVAVELEERWKRHRRWPAVTWQPWAVLVGGAATGLAGFALDHAADVSYERYEQRVAACALDRQQCEPTDFAHLRAQGDTQRALSFAAYGVSAAALVTGGVLAYLNRSVAHRVKQPLAAQARAIQIMPLAGPGLGGATVMGRF
jgi:hypothetical protein